MHEHRLSRGRFWTLGAEAVAAASMVISVGCDVSGHPTATPEATISLLPGAGTALAEFSIRPGATQPPQADLTPQETASPAGTPIIAPGVGDRLPQAPLPDGFFVPGAGEANFDVYTRVIARSGDWLLATHATSAYPIPSGWTTLNSFFDENLVIFHRDGVEVDGFVIKSAEVAIQISPVFQKETTDIEEILDSHESRLSDQSGVEVLVREAFGDDRGYLLIHGKGLGEAKGYALLFLTLRSHSTGDGFDSLVAYWSEDAAAEYYSIVRTIVGGWVDLENRVLGAELPQTLPSR